MLMAHLHKVRVVLDDNVLLVAKHSLASPVYSSQRGDKAVGASCKIKCG